MPKLPRASGDKHIPAFKAAGWQLNHIEGSHYILTKENYKEGSHIVLVNNNDGLKRAVVVPNHKEIDPGTLLEIRNDFEKLI